MFEPQKAAGGWDTYGIGDALWDWMSEAREFSKDFIKSTS